MKRFLILSMAVVAVGALAAVATAGPIPASIIPGNFLSDRGESWLFSTNPSTPNNNVRIDWMVVDANAFAPGSIVQGTALAYLYQIENTSNVDAQGVPQQGTGVDIRGFEVTFNTSTLTTLVPAVCTPGVNCGAGYAPANLDNVGLLPFGAGMPVGIGGHNSTDSAFLGTETELAPTNVDLTPAGTAPPPQVALGAMSVSWTWGGTGFINLQPGEQSGIFFIIDNTLNPVYGRGQVFGQSPFSPWTTDPRQADLIPSNKAFGVSEPGTMLLLGLGLGALGLRFRRRREEN